MIDQNAAKTRPGPTPRCQIISGNAAARSWREKLGVVQTLLADETSELTLEDLADAAIYLRFLSTGEIPCVEDGRHFRPNHHARIATEIHGRLARHLAGEGAFLARKILACLPSTAAPFQRAEPLTRIRDIAHRNDIPHDLKREIKTTLQNKLHRCAGPEDLVTSARLLARITAPGAQYSGEFVEQCKIFHGELSEFFNARSLEERLQALTANADGATRELIDEFLKAKQAGQHCEALAALTRLRQQLIEALASKADAEQQEFWLTDIALEKYAFVLLSEALNDSEGGFAGELLNLTLTNLQLSQIAPAETVATQNEISAVHGQLESDDRDSRLRLKAAIERARHLAGEFSDAVLMQLAERAAALGEKLGVAPHAIRVFAEGEVRAHLVFQLDKLASEWLRQLREALGQSPWDVIVTGRTTGRLISAHRLGEIDPAGGPLIVALVEAEGDEEIPAGVKGILLAHELPHLSHLGVRARQAGVVFAGCEEESLWEEIRNKAGEHVALSASSGGIQIESAKAGATTEAGDKSRARAVPRVKLQSKPNVLPLDKVAAATGGNKSDGARRLLELSRLKGARFSAPDGMVVPFGVMEFCLQTDARIHDEYQSLLGKLNKLDAGELAVTAAKLRQLVMRVKVPDSILAAVAEKFGRSQRLAVRSSANSEDLAEMAGAGLHESVAGVTADEFEAALRSVWASLWTDRAVASRRQAGIPHEAAHMAVLIQPLAEAELSFILHTVNPVNQNPQECYVELAVGLGETLASAAARGTPYRMTCDRKTGRVTMLAFANFSYALVAGDCVRAVAADVSPLRLNGGGSESRLTPAAAEQRVDYSQVAFTTDAELRAKIGARLADISNFIEREFGVPQDVEGVICGDEIILVQSRAQQGIRKS